MSNIEAVICLVLLFMAVPDLCQKIGKPALIFSAFVLFGLILIAIRYVVALRLGSSLDDAPPRTSGS